MARFGLRAFRRPLDEETLLRLVNEIEASYLETRQFNESIELPPSPGTLLAAFSVLRRPPARSRRTFTLGANRRVFARRG